MRTAVLITFALIWILSLIVLAAALIDLFPDNPLKEYRLVVGLGFFVVTQLVRKAYRHLNRVE